MIGDVDPEDAYDASDPPAMRLAVLDDVVDALEFEPDDGRHELRRVDALRLVARLQVEVIGVDLIRLIALRERLEAL